MAPVAMDIDDEGAASFSSPTASSRPVVVNAKDAIVMNADANFASASQKTSHFGRTFTTAS